MNQKQIYKIAGSFFLLTECAKQLCLTFYINQGHYSYWYFPFQLCSIPMYLCLFMGFFNNSNIECYCKTFLMDYGLLAGVFAFFDTTGMHYNFMPLTLHSYLWHIAMIILGIYTGFHLSHNRITWKNYGISTFIFLFCCLIATIINVILHPYGLINMFYISPYYKMTQVVFIRIATAIGDTAAKFVYIGSIILGAAILHFLWTRLRLSHKTIRDTKGTNL